jgi:beta-phosphoglucomutase-like phosphatase (HAD superfamily)
MCSDTVPESHLTLKHILPRVKAVLFDFDGVIADTEQYQAKSYAKILADYGIDFGIDDFKPYVGKPETEIYAMLERRYGIVIDVSKVSGSRANYVLEDMISGNLQPYPYVSPTLMYLNHLGLPAYILSANNADTIRRLLARWSMESKFVHIYTVFDFSVPLTKVELINIAPSLVGYPAEQLAIVEDSPTAIEAANQLGMLTVGVLSSLNRGTALEAHVVIDPTSYLGEDLNDPYPRKSQ